MNGRAQWLKDAEGIEEAAQGRTEPVEDAGYRSHAKRNGKPYSGSSLVEWLLRGPAGILMCSVILSKTSLADMADFETAKPHKNLGSEEF